MEQTITVHINGKNKFKAIGFEEKPIVSMGNSAHILLSKKFIGMKAIVFILKDEEK